MTTHEELVEAARKYELEQVAGIRKHGGSLFDAFWKGKRGLNAHEYDVALRSRLAQYGTRDGCFLIPIGGGDGTGEIANMLETLDRELGDARVERFPKPGQRVRVISGTHAGQEGRAEVWTDAAGDPYPSVSYPWNVFFDDGDRAPFRADELEPAERPLNEHRPSERSFWVVEQWEHGHSIGYWTGHSRMFTKDIHKAVQFCRHEDAFWVTKDWHWTDTKIVEHLMLPDAPPRDAECPPSNGGYVGGNCPKCGQHDIAVDKLPEPTGADWDRLDATTGLPRAATEPCPNCNGLGSVRRALDNRPRNCPDCEGTGCR